MNATIAERVAAGAAWLDTAQPDWIDRVDLEELAMASCKQCVLGQVFGDYWEAPFPDSLPFTAGEFARFQRVAAEHGFQSWIEADSEELYALSVAWWNLIESRRGAS